MKNNFISAYPKLKGFSAHGVYISKIHNQEQAQGDCPFCGKEKHFYINIDKKLWDCKRCGKSGDYHKFLHLISLQNQISFKSKPAKDLSISRGLKIDSLRRAGVGYSNTMKHYTLPIFDLDGIKDLKIYSIGKKINSSPGGQVWLFNFQALAKNKARHSEVWLCEGEFDTITMMEVTGGNAVCVGTSASLFKREYIPYFENCIVHVLFDNDQAGATGMNKVYNALINTVKSIDFIYWPEKLPSGFDINDLYIMEGSKTLDKIREMLESAPPRDELKILDQQPTQKTVRRDGKGLDKNVVVEEYRKFLFLPNSEPLDIMFGTIFANRLPGDPVWLFMVAPPGGSKSELLMTLSECDEVTAISNLTPKALISGAYMPGGGDPSLIPRLDGQVLVIKDFTAILSLHYTARDEIFGTLRDAYDGNACKPFGVGKMIPYKSRFGVLGGVTPELDSFTSVNAALGERFLRYKIVFKSIDEDELIMRAMDNVTKEKIIREALKQVAVDCLNVDVNGFAPLVPDWYKLKILGLAKWLAKLRTTVNKDSYTNKMTVRPTPEIATRLSKQLIKLSIGIAIYHRSEELSIEHYKTIVKVVRDTVPGKTEDAVRRMYLKRKQGWTRTEELARECGFNVDTIRYLLQDLSLLRVVEREEGVLSGRWKLTDNMINNIGDLGIYTETKKRRRLENEKNIHR